VRRRHGVNHDDVGEAARVNASSAHGLRCGVRGDIEHIGPGAALLLDLSSIERHQ
jgi:hypothetical protein